MISTKIAEMAATRSAPTPLAERTSSDAITDNVFPTNGSAIWKMIAMMDRTRTIVGNEICPMLTSRNVKPLSSSVQIVLSVSPSLGNATVTCKYILKLFLIHDSYYYVS